MRVLTVANQKGGVGKTTLACHLALAAHEAELRVLLVDLDTQGSASSILTRDPAIARSPGGAAALFSGNGLAPTPTPLGVDLLHGHQRLDAVDREPQGIGAGRGEKLASLGYDLVVVDTPPALGPRHLAPLLWSDLVLIPLEPNASAVQGLAQTLGVLASVRRLRPGLRSVVAVNLYRRVSSGQNRYLRELERRVELLRPYLTQRVAVADALDAGVPVWRFSRADRELRETWRSFCRGLIA